MTTPCANSLCNLEAIDVVVDGDSVIFLCASCAEAFGLGQAHPGGYWPGMEDYIRLTTWPVDDPTSEALLNHEIMDRPDEWLFDGQDQQEG